MGLAVVARQQQNPAGNEASILKQRISEKWNSGRKDRLEMGQMLCRLRTLLHEEAASLDAWLKEIGLPSGTAYHMMNLAEPAQSEITAEDLLRDYGALCTYLAKDFVGRSPSLTPEDVHDISAFAQMKLVQCPPNHRHEPEYVKRLVANAVSTEWRKSLKASANYSPSFSTENPRKGEPKEARYQKLLEFSLQQYFGMGNIPEALAEFDENCKRVRGDLEQMLGSGAA